jgi:hypothetical protein
MNRWAKGAIAVTAGFSVATAAIEITSRIHSAEHAGTKLGRLDLRDFCTKAYGDGALAINLRNDAVGWKCSAKVNGIVSGYDIDYDQACAQMYDSPAYASSYDISWAYSWECFRGPKKTRS